MGWWLQLTLKCIRNIRTVGWSTGKWSSKKNKMVSCRLVVEFLWWIKLLHLCYKFETFCNKMLGKKPPKEVFFFFSWCKWPLSASFMSHFWCSKQERTRTRSAYPSRISLLRHFNLQMAFYFCLGVVRSRECVSNKIFSCRGMLDLIAR